MKNLIRLMCYALLGFSLIASRAWAEEKFERSGYWGGLDLGAGFVELSSEEIEEDDTLFYLGFEGGYTLNPHFLIGIELSGWSIEDSGLCNPGDCDPTEGEGISQVFLVSRYYPSNDLGLFAKFGGGYVSHWNNAPGESRKHGWGLTFGGGYDFPVSENVAITPFVAYNFGETDDQDHNIWTLGIGFTFQ